MDNNEEIIDEESYLDPNETQGEYIIDNKQQNIPDDEDEDEDIEMGEGDEEMQDEEEEDDFVDESIQGFFEHTDAIYCTRAHKIRPELAITGGGDDLAYLWNTITGDRIYQLKGHSDSISSVEFNFNGTLVATGGMDGVIKIWDVATGELKNTLEGPSESIEWMQWHPEGNFILAGSSDSCAFMWSTLKSNFVSSFIAHRGSVTCGGFTCDGKQVITASEDGTMRIWNPKDATTIFNFQNYGFHESLISCLSVQKNTNLVLTAGDDTFACLSNIKSGKVINRLKGHTTSISAVSFSNSNVNFCVTGGMDGSCKVWDIATQQERVSFKHKNTITKILCHPVDPIVFTSSVDKTIQMWDERNGQLIKPLLGHQDGILDFDLTIDNRIITASDDKVSLVFSLKPNPTTNSNNTTTTTTTTFN
ncbi:WD40 repeat-containing protein [Tieghemostelium lacteum]|uniref:WD40 repeat-containing protein n=1 Tax=Tieghemostelium lacteum TaxID=361077 RepID=A0A152A1B3_TIELA|nr:WD40 repeat-containing protein [Tieghemostelium lacteum]|eukprot:KYR00016.1 WD40 repeat-containing protein [Tieghemostelium lacteum]